MVEREREISMKRCVGLLASQEVVKKEESRVKRRLPQNENPLDIVERGICSVVLGLPLARGTSRWSSTAAQKNWITLKSRFY